MNENKSNNVRIDLSGALKDSGTGVKFEDSGWRVMKYYRQPGTPRIVQWTMWYSGGLVKDERQAQYVLLGFVVAAIAVSLYLFFGAGTGTQQQFTPENFTPITRPTVSP